ncbi:MAG: AAA family ATPase [Chloroflexi bacterium]|nr:AAA family ATPase [Chloroflexota bacterium]
MVHVAMPELPTVLTTAELCERWRCNPRTLERMARDGRIRRVKLRGGVRYPVDEILRIERGEDPCAALPALVEIGASPGAADDRPSLPPIVEKVWYTVCVAHRKGGVAKSTTTWYLARELARAGKRVILRDLDPQQGLRDILRDHGCEDGRYSKAIALVQDGEPLPFTPHVELIDTPPALDDSLPGVARADAVIVPAMPEHQAVRALERMLLVLQQTRHEHPFTRVLGLLPVRVKARWSEHTAFLQQIALLGERFGHPVLPAIPESRAVLTYSLRGRLWRPVAEAILADLERYGPTTRAVATGAARTRQVEG